VALLVISNFIPHNPCTIMDSRGRRLSHGDYTAAYICPMGVELAAVEGMLDEIHESLPSSRDQNGGRSGTHNASSLPLKPPPTRSNDGKQWYYESKELVADYAQIWVLNHGYTIKIRDNKKVLATYRLESLLCSLTATSQATEHIYITQFLARPALPIYPLMLRGRMPALPQEEYYVGWICALRSEMVVAIACWDDRYPKVET
jgi:hypothetical protein